MNVQDRCPVCERPNFEVLHRFTLVDTFQKPERNIQKTNSYHRNYILFEKILQRRTKEFQVEFRLCKHCGFIFYSPRPDEADLAIKYEMVVEQADTVEREGLRRVVDLRQLRADKIRQLLKPRWRKNSGRALDIGGADGHCLAGLTSTFDCGVLDFETREMWPRVKKWGNSLDDLRPDEQFDVIMTCHTLEHIPNLNSFIGDIVEHMAEEGILYIEVPLGCSGEIYHTSNFLTHLNFFSEGSLGFLLEQAGLHVEYSAARPVLSMNRYYGVVVVIARKDSSRRVGNRFLTNGFALTKRQMPHNLSRRVALANAKLVASQPLKYGLAFARRWLRIRRLGRAA